MRAGMNRCEESELNHCYSLHCSNEQLSVKDPKTVSVKGDAPKAAVSSICSAAFVDIFNI